MKAADLQSVYNLVQNTLQISYRDVYPAEAIDFFKDYHRKEVVREEAVNGYTVVAELGGVTVGTGTLLGTNVRRVFISPEHQRRGIGKAIAGDLERRAMTMGIAKLDLSSSLKSKEFWEAMGFVSSGEFSLPVGSGQKLVFYEMTKSLQR